MKKIFFSVVFSRWFSVFLIHEILFANFAKIINLIFMKVIAKNSFDTYRLRNFKNTPPLLLKIKTKNILSISNKKK